MVLRDSVVAVVGLVGQKEKEQSAVLSPRCSERLQRSSTSAEAAFVTLKHSRRAHLQQCASAVVVVTSRKGWASDRLQRQEIEKIAIEAAKYQDCQKYWLSVP